MSETQAVTETASVPMQKAEKRAQTTGVRFTPLRSTIVTKKRSRTVDSDRILSRLAPIRRLQS